MKKIIFVITFLIIILLSGLCVYGNRKEKKPARQVLECGPAPILKTKATVIAESHLITISPLLF